MMKAWNLPQTWEDCLSDFRAYPKDHLLDLIKRQLEGGFGAESDATMALICCFVIIEDMTRPAK